MSERPFAEQHVLSNGTTLINIFIPGHPVVQFQHIAKLGSRDETAEQAGLAHFNEHMFFKGSQKRPQARMISSAVENLGGGLNAFTSTEMVSYYAWGPSESLPVLADVITDMLSHPLFDPKEIDLERHPVLEEMATFQQKIGGKLYHGMLQACFAGQSVGWSAIGYEDVVRSADQALLAAYHRGYDASQMAIIVCGGNRLDVATAEKLVAGFPRGKRAERKTPQWGTGPEWVAAPVAYSKENGARVDAVFALPGFANDDPDALAADVLAAILSWGAGSRLNAVLKRRPQLASDLSVDSDNYEGFGIVSLETSTTLAQQEAAARTLFAELQNLAAKPVSESDLQRAKQVISASLFRSTEPVDRRLGAAGLCQWVARRWAAGLPLQSPAEVAGEVQQVSAQDVQRVARRLLAGMGQLRLSFTYQAEPLTGKNQAGQTAAEQGALLRKTALAATLGTPGRELG